MQVCLEPGVSFPITKIVFMILVNSIVNSQKLDR